MIGLYIMQQWLKSTFSEYPAMKLGVVTLVYGVAFTCHSLNPELVELLIDAGTFGGTLLIRKLREET